MDTHNTYVIGDIHGSYKALLQCFERSQFKHEQDHLIVLGDVCDGYPDIKQCIDELLRIKHCEIILGNHDKWTLDWMLYNGKPLIWTSQGGEATLRSYNNVAPPQDHISFLRKAKTYIEYNNKLFVHGGFNPNIPIDEQSQYELMWDRNLIELAVKKVHDSPSHIFGGYTDIFVGHTTTQKYNSLKPLHFCNVWSLDTGAGWSGKLTMMEIDSKQYWQSDLSSTLYNGLPNKLTRKVS